MNKYMEQLEVMDQEEKPCKTFVFVEFLPENQRSVIVVSAPSEREAIAVAAKKAYGICPEPFEVPPNSVEVF